MMKAITQHRYGSYEVLTYEEIDRPTPGAGQVLLRVAAAGVDPGQWHMMAGLPLAARLAFGLSRPRARVRGRDVAGTVVALGPALPMGKQSKATVPGPALPMGKQSKATVLGPALPMGKQSKATVRGSVTALAVGDEVFGVADGSFAEYAVAKASLVVRRPASVTPVQAAATPTSGYTALRAIAKTSLAPGQRALVIGAGGGVGTMLVQVLASRGVLVTGACSASKLDLVRSLGAASVIDYRVSPLGVGYDAVFDIAGLRGLGDLRALLTSHGTLVLIGGEDDGRWVGGATTRSLRAHLLNLVTTQRLRPVLALENRADLEELASLLAAGTLTPLIDRTFALAETPAALRLLMEGEARGKLVVTP
ncbi:NAD(P)-dependent alcohol dehydrogenase [Actinoplanes sp. NBRC 103695]|uniref:NAD(P)-dependent alcohol dehydrogenase n=1 Tax=Actinoplanes sp. NBRC 103695 TaxID=3032202 RepID=UPI0024A0841A|nr:NAD(P)-dependent alcohol dehydrogenase [Actinoplanes sp. NBRC 103695]GLY94301.1 NADPH:quinone reductase [Actinoplanes sp. NBRC 103695]